MNLDNHVELIQNPNPFLSFLSRKSHIPTLVNIFNNFEKMSQVITRKLAGYPTTISLHKNKQIKEQTNKTVPKPFHFTNLSLSSFNNNQNNVHKILKLFYSFSTKFQSSNLYSLYPKAQRAKKKKLLVSHNSQWHWHIPKPSITPTPTYPRTKTTSFWPLTTRLSTETVAAYSVPFY